MAALAELLQPDDALVVISALTPDRGRDVRTMMRNLAMGEHLGRAIAETPVLTSSISAPTPSTPMTSIRCGSLRPQTRAVSTASCTWFVSACWPRPPTRRRFHYLILRPSTLYGPGDTHNAYGPNRFVRTARMNVASSSLATVKKRDHVYIDDLVRLIGSCLEHRGSGVLNVATGQSISFFELADSWPN